VFAAPGNEELAFEQEPEIPGAEERALARVGKTCEEGLLGLYRMVPVALGNAIARDPDFADAVRRRAEARLRIHDDHGLASRKPTRRNESACVRFASRKDVAVRERFAARPILGESGTVLPSRHHERRLGESVARMESFKPKAAGAEYLGEPLQGLGPDWFGTVHGADPAAQVELRPLLRRHLADAEIVSEVGSSAVRPLVLRDGR